METIIILIIIIGIISLIVGIALLIRNERVCNFRLECNKLCFDYNIRHKTKALSDECAWTWFFGKYEYNDFMKSFKPLKLENWYTQELIEKIYS